MGDRTSNTVVRKKREMAERMRRLASSLSDPDQARFVVLATSLEAEADVLEETEARLRTAAPSADQD